MSAEPLDLTSRQKQVVGLLAQGLTDIQIAERLGTTPRTAKAHCDVLRHKLGVPKRRQIPVAYKLATGVDPLTLAEVPS